MDGEASDVEHAHVHTDFANDGHFLALDDDRALAVAQLARVSVGVANGDDGHLTVTFEPVAAVVADGLASGNLFYLCDDCLQSGYVMEFGSQIRKLGASVQADAEPHHVELGLREAGDAGTVEDVAQDLVVKSAAKIAGHVLKQSNLLVGVVVFARIFGGRQVRENGCDMQLRVFADDTDELRKVGFIKS